MRGRRVPSREWGPSGDGHNGMGGTNLWDSRVCGEFAGPHGAEVIGNLLLQRGLREVGGRLRIIQVDMREGRYYHGKIGKIGKA